MKRMGLLCTLFLCLFSIQSLAQVSVGESGELSGRVYSDFYWMAQNREPAIEGDNGFWIRRIYLTYERDLGGSFSSRLRLEMSSPGDFLTDSKLSPVVKDAYLKWQNEQHEIFAGISSTPTWGIVEDVWGYRSVEKSPQDLYDFGSSRDFGLSAKGQFDESGRLNYHIFLGNGNSNASEIDEGKKIMLSLSSNLTDHFVFEIYGDANSLPAGNSYTAQGFLGYQSAALNIGALYAFQKRENTTVGDRELQLASVFSNMRFNDTVKGYLRADHLFNPYIGGDGNDYIPFDPNAPESTFLVGGVDILLSDQIHLMPNLEAIIYGDSLTEVQGDPDLIPRMTLFYSF